MPKRPRSHQIEDESHLKFDEALGPRLVYRREVPDYSIDGEVEEFDSNDQATGLRFYVQVKATDESELSVALGVSLKLDMASHYRALPLPVLMVRYHAPSETLYGRWFHQFDPYYGGVGKKTLTFRWQKSDVLTHATPERLCAEARAFLTLRSPQLPKPLELYLDTPDHGAFGLSATEILYALRGAAGRRSDLFAVRSGAAPGGTTRLLIRDDLMAINLAEVSTATVHLEAYDPGPNGKVLAIDAMVTAALALEHAGHADLASQLASTFFAESSLVAAPEMAWALSSSLFRSRRLHESQAVCEALDARGDPDGIAASDFFTLPTLLHRRHLSATETEAFVRLMDSRINRREAAGEPVAAARNAYTLANFLRGQARPDDALARYEEAARGDPGYLERGYYWHEIAGVLFGSHRYPEAAQAYQRAFELGADPMTAALGADALMFAGRYEDALSKFTSYNHAHPDGAAEWRLKEVFLEVLVNQFEMRAQARDQAGATSRAEATDLEQDPETVSFELDEVLQYDALNGWAWALMGAAHLELSKPDAALVDYLGAALTIERDGRAWVMALAMALERGQHLVSDIVACAARMAGSDFRRQLVELSRDTDEDFPREQFLAMIDKELEREESVPDDSFTLRVLHTEGEIDEYELGSSRDRGHDPKSS